MPRMIHLVVLAAAGLSTACNMRVGNPQPSPWALTYPDTVPVKSGRVVRFSASYGLGGPSPALMFRQQGSSVSGQMLVSYRAFQPADAGHRSAADSAAEWKRMQSGMAHERARLDSLYGCKAWVRGNQEGPAWVCRVPEQQGSVNWARELRSIDSLVAKRAAAGPPGGRRYAPDTTRAERAPPPPPRTPTRVPTGGVTGCYDGGGWTIQIRDSLGTKTITPPASSGCPRPAGAARTYDEAGWRMLRDFIAAVK